MGEMIGAELPKSGSVKYLVLMSFLLGTAITVAEPDVRVLAHQIDFVSAGLVSRGVLVFVVAVSVGVCVAGAVLRSVVGVPIVRVLMAGYAAILALSSSRRSSSCHRLRCRRVTTGPVTVPFIIALGLGTVGVLRGRSSFSDGFGLVGLASIGPVIGVMLLGMIYG
jgi:hypothetical protein